MARLFATLIDGWACRDGSRATLEAAIGHAMRFESWRSLTRASLSDDQARGLLVNVAVAVADGRLTATA